MNNVNMTCNMIMFICDLFFFTTCRIMLMTCNLHVEMNKSCMDICVIILHVDIIHLAWGGGRSMPP